MKIIKGILKIFGKIFARIMAPILVMVLVAVTVVSTVSEFTKPDAIMKQMQQLDYKEIIADKEVAALLEKYDVNGELLQQYSSDGEMGEMLENLMGTMDAQALEDIFGTYMDNIESVMSGSGEISLFGDQFKINGSVSKGIEILKSGNLVHYLMIAAVALSVLIVICRWERFEGFLWLGGLYFSSTIISLMIIIFLKDPSRLQMFESATELPSIVDMIMAMLADGLTRGTLILASLSIVFFTVHLCGKLLFRR